MRKLKTHLFFLRDVIFLYFLLFQIFQSKKKKTLQQMENALSCNENVLHRVLFHPQIHQIMLEILNSYDTISLLGVDKCIRNSIPRRIKKAQICLKNLHQLLANGFKFPNLVQLKVESTRRGEISLGSTDFPNLQELIVNERCESASPQNINLDMPTVQTLLIRCNQMLPSAISLRHSSLRKFHGRLYTSVADQLFPIQTNLETIDVHFVRDQHPYVNFQANTSLRRLSCFGNSETVMIQSLRELEVLELYNVKWLVSEHASTSSIRWMTICTTSPDEDIFNAIKFPQLNFFQANHTTSHELLYKQCIERNQTQMAPYDDGRKLKVISNFDYLYCNQCQNVSRLVILQNAKQHVFIQGTEMLKELQMNYVHDQWHIRPESSVLEHVEIPLTSLSINILQSPIFEQVTFLEIQIEDLRIWNSISSNIPRNIKKLLLHVLDNEENRTVSIKQMLELVQLVICFREIKKPERSVILSDLPKLQKCRITPNPGILSNYDTTPRFRFYFDNIPNLEMLEVAGNNTNYTIAHEDDQSHVKIKKIAICS